MEDLKENRIESGIYIRVGTNNVLLENLEEYQRNDWLNSLEKDGLIRTINHFCSILNSLNSNED